MTVISLLCTVAGCSVDGAGLLGPKSSSADSADGVTADLERPGELELPGHHDHSDCTESGDTQLLSDQLLRLINM